MRSLSLVAVIGGLVLVSGQSHGAEPGSPAAAVQPAAKDFVTVYGQVMRRGKYEWKPQVTVPQALQLAGGATHTANLKKVRLLRKIKAKTVCILINLNHQLVSQTG